MIKEIKNTIIEFFRVSKGEALIIIIVSLLLSILVVYGIPFHQCMVDHPCTGISSCDFWRGY